VYAEGRYYAATSEDEVVAIDPTSGNREYLPKAAGAIAIGDAQDIDYDWQARELVVFDTEADRLIGIELTTGTRRTLLDEFFAEDFVADGGGGRVIYASGGELSWNELSARGHSTLYAPPARGELPGVAAFDATDEEVCGLTSDVRALACAELASAELDRIEGDGEPPAVGLSSFTVADDDAYYLGTVQFFSNGVPTITRIDRQSGDITVVSEAADPGPAIGFPVDGAYDGMRDRLVVLDATLPSLLEIDPTSGERENISGGPVGEGVAWTMPYAMAYDDANDRALVVDTSRLVSVALDDGERTLLSGDGTGEGPQPMNLTGVALDAARGRVIVRDTMLGLLAIDLESGERTLLYEPSVAASTLAPVFAMPGKVEYDPDRRVILLIDGVVAPALLEIDELTGDATMLLGRVP
jgi:hypothetical protein